MNLSFRPSQKILKKPKKMLESSTPNRPLKYLVRRVGNKVEGNSGDSRVGRFRRLGEMVRDMITIYNDMFIDLYLRM